MQYNDSTDEASTHGAHEDPFDLEACNSRDVDGGKWTVWENDSWAAYCAEDEAENGPLNGRRVKLIAASNMRIRRVKWLHGSDSGGLIPLGAMTLLAGREGIGKSTIADSFAAQITRGTMPGEFRGTPKSVVIYCTEDDWEPVILPRLMAAGADLSRILRATVSDPEGDLELSVPRDLRSLGEVCRENDVALVIIDPLMSIIDSKRDTHKDREVRTTLEPLVRFAGAANVAIVGLAHVNKSAGLDVLNSIMASKAFTAVPRSVLYCQALTAEDDAAEEYHFSQPKCNLGPKQNSQRYHIVTHQIAAEEPDGTPFTVHTSRIEWGEVDRRSAADVLEDTHESKHRAPGSGAAVNAAAGWLKNYLVTSPTGVESSIVKAAAEQAGHNSRTLARARDIADVYVERRGMPAKSYWSVEV